MSKRMTYEDAMKEILDFFDGNKDKALTWWITPNPGIGNISPFLMVKNGRGEKLIKFIRSSLDGNFP